MTQIPSKKIKIASIISGIVLLIIIGIILFKFIDKTTPDSIPTVTDAIVRGFTFLDMHADSILTDSARDRLRKSLGSEAIEKKTVLDLEMHYPGFLENYFPDLNELNKQLNFEGGRRTRIEHNTTKLIYRYSTTFHYVELFFSNYTQKPLLFRVKAKRDGMDYLATLQQKYGEPREVVWQNQKGKSLFWKLDKDVLILSLFVDQYDQPQFEIMICRAENIEELLTTEKKESRQRKTGKTEAGRKLF
ncbi:MAG: hypothetical protein P1P89_20455 [Desulfobacterales bacterium]|nr:hypothetical protein [Desulfobacterales bacterium]